jgi:hypothetical protein
MDEPASPPTIAKDGWTLLSAEERALAYPATFQLPPLTVRHSLSPGDAAKLLFDIETTENGHVVDRGVDRMWVIVQARTEHGYLGILDSDPGAAENLALRAGDQIAFGPEHVVEIGCLPRDYVFEKYGASFFHN